MTDLYVFKLGGSSVSSIGALQHFARRLERFAGQRILVVVSALSGVTDQLVKLANLVAKGSSEEIRTLLDDLRSRHLTMLSQLLHSEQAPGVGASLVALLKELEAYCATWSGRPIEARNRDRILTFGEGLSSILVEAFIASRGIEIRRINAADILVTDDQFGTAEPLGEPSLVRLKAIVRPLLAQGTAVITQGFCGATFAGEATTLGRGGSDFSATYLGALLDAREIEIRTDTPGVLSADPRSVPNTRIVREISHRRASTLAHFGAKVLHPRCIEPVIESGIPVRVLSSFDPEDPGTLIGSEDQSGSFSVTGRKGWLVRGERPESLSFSGFRGAAQGLQQVAGFLAGECDARESISTWEHAPAAQDLPPELRDHLVASPSGLLYVMTTDMEQSLLRLIEQHLSSQGIAVQAYFVDDRAGGLVLAISEHQIASACQHVHRLFVQISPAVSLV